MEPPESPSTDRALRAEHHRTLALLPVPALVTDAEGVVAHANDAALALLGAHDQPLVGRLLTDLVSEEDRAVADRLVLSVRSGGLAKGLVRLPGAEPDPVTVRLSGSGSPGRSPDEETWWVLEPLATDDRALHEALVALGSLSTSSEQDAHETLRRVARVCATALRQDVSVCLGDPTEPRLVATSSDLAAHLDGLQLETGEGPSLDALRRRAPVTALSLSDGERWGRLAQRLDEPAPGAAAVPLRSGDHVVGVITTYVPAGRLPVTEPLELLAVTTGTVLHERELRTELAQLQEQMRQALDSRAVIEQAKGIVMRTRLVDAETAWEHLVTLSNQQNVKLRVVAEGIVGSIPDV